MRRLQTGSPQEAARKENMKYIDYQERKEQGTFSFPVAYYHLTPHGPRYHMQYHWHTHYEIIRIFSGTFHLTLDNELRILTAGDCVLVTGGSLHGGTPYDDCIYDCVLFDLQIMARQNHVCGKTVHDILSHQMTPFSFLTDYCAEILPIVDLLCQALSEKKEGYEFATQGYLYLFLSVILRNHLYEENNYDRLAASRLSSIKNVLTHIAEHYANHITLDQLARIAGMNPRYFCRYFKSMTERTPIDYLNYYRIECACEMLSTRDISIKEAAISCGFNDESYFIRTFHKYKGITPKQFVKAEF